MFCNLHVPKLAVAEFWVLKLTGFSGWFNIENIKILIRIDNEYYCYLFGDTYFAVSDFNKFNFYGRCIRYDSWQIYFYNCYHPVSTPDTFWYLAFDYFARLQKQMKYAWHKLQPRHRDTHAVQSSGALFIDGGVVCHKHNNQDSSFPEYYILNCSSILYYYEQMRSFVRDRQTLTEADLPWNEHNQIYKAGSW